MKRFMVDLQFRTGRLLAKQVRVAVAAPLLAVLGVIPRVLGQAHRRLCVSALARETLLTHGSDAFVRAEAQAMKWASEASSSRGPFTEAIRERSRAVVQDIFRMADG